MIVGYSKVIITPNKPMTMSGYDNRHKMAKDVHDDLYARCLIIKINGDSVVMISLDLLGVDETLTNKIKDALINIDEKLTRKAIFVCATHTHSGPSNLFLNRDGYNIEYVDDIVSKCKLAFLDAEDDLKKSAVFFGYRNITGIGLKRNSPNIEKKNKYIKCYFLKIKRNGEDILLINFPCHMTVLDENNLYYSKDLIYGMELTFNDKGINKFLFMNGAAGDISTRYYKKESSFDEAERLGRSLAEQILDTDDEGLSEVYAEDIVAEEFALLLKYREALTEDEKKARVDALNKKLLLTDDYRQKRDIESSLMVLNRPNKKFEVIPDVIKLNGKYFKKIKIPLVIIGKLAYIGIPLEIYYSTGIKIQNIINKKFGVNHTFIFGYCGGYGGYMPPTKEFNQMTYEVVACPFERDSEDKLLEKLSEDRNEKMY
ncbi:neutral/alkaline non-lysosomal ceramidase N-terminal domain-containing protein [Acidilutibacter cellobiosedens]|nr:neutral/alkaline non-lysosomal ceramidase N-terminal domain-containing protein [Acidilutibacter cellobiosedens]